MKRMGILAAALLLQGLALQGLGMPAAQADPGEQPEISVTRTATTDLTINGELSKNEYQYVERDVVEVVQVPYTVEVPYQVAETYYVNEQVCGSRPERVCHSEQRCREVQRPERVCHNERRCTRDGHCTSHPVCKDVMKHERVCSAVPVCREESRYSCWYQNVPHTRVVTRYREETRYRPEQRHRTVTDKIFDHQWGVQVHVVLPEDSRLEGNEQETVLIRLAGTEDAPAVEVSVDSNIFSYRMVNEQKDGNSITVTLGLVAKYDPSDLAEQTIEGLSMQPDGQGGQIVAFTDKGIVARTTTHYWIAVGDRDTATTIFETEADGAFGSRQIAIPVKAQVVQEHDHVIRLTVHREGKVISGPVEFVKVAQQVGQLDPAPYQDPNGVREFSIQGMQDGAQLVFTDATPNNHKVDTTYAIKLLRKRPWWQLGLKQTLAEATLKREDLRAGDNQTVLVDLKSFPGLSEKELRKYFKEGDGIRVEIQVTRVSPRLRGASPIVFKKEAKLRVK